MAQRLLWLPLVTAMVMVMALSFALAQTFAFESEPDSAHSSSSAAVQGVECPEEWSELASEEAEGEGDDERRLLWPRTELPERVLKASWALAAMRASSPSAPFSHRLDFAKEELQGLRVDVRARPRCFDESGQEVVRHCSTRGWDPAEPPRCFVVPPLPTPSAQRAYPPAAASEEPSPPSPAFPSIPPSPSVSTWSPPRPPPPLPTNRREPPPPTSTPPTSPQRVARDPRPRSPTSPPPPPLEARDAGWGRCPPPYAAVAGTRGGVCLMTAEAAPWAPVCLRTGTSDSLLELKEDELRATLAELRRRGAARVWLPAARDGAFGPLLRRLPGRRWLDPFPDPDKYVFTSLLLDF
ncbi:hypothetical protein R5R35_007754 [Gryllus longicercus]|uniref:Uncharacterized protein n=1 Tax=Gryllus longicercus TaxID=2509291 RepID=A0AAN9YZ85_9ORTH